MRLGSHVLHQVPEGSVTPSPSPTARAPLFDFSSVSDCIIPRQEFCDRLVTVCVNHYRIIGYPICISNYEGKYNRNQFIFNFALVLDEDAEWGPYASVVRKLARILKSLEEQAGFLSREEDPAVDKSPGSVLRAERVGSDTSSGTAELNGDVSELLLDSSVPPTPAIAAVNSLGRSPSSMEVAEKPAGITGGKVYALCEMILEDLNAYCECMIPVDDYNTINLKLFPLHPPPAPVHAWHVPLLTIDLSSFNTPFDPHHSNFSETSNNSLSSDLTLTRILPWINGIRSVAHIALLADVALDLAKKAIQHLLLYGCVILLDILQFSASYACTPAIGALVENEDGVLDECARYVYIPWLMDRQSHSKIEPQNGRTAEKEETPEDQAMKEVVNHELRKETLTRLYTTLRQGVPLREWVAANRDELQIIDVRRLITFGVIKGFLYRVHKYALATVPSLSGESAPNGYESSSRGGNNGAAWGDARENLPLARYLDGLHCFDEICTELAMPEKDVLGKMRRAYGNVQIIQR
ncbi:Nitrogen permease regulator 2 [Coniosporium apollinis]|uniref:Nitrogen permease regulator 2 n=1 Tax=Coniosporium apollinis TaxID=61459 RepID=A0ABQ9P193_9PEZI|nr:Nitrogen permease regulator 2 [Coniosporium apollinis]